MGIDIPCTKYSIEGNGSFCAAYETATKIKKTHEGKKISKSMPRPQNNDNINI